MEPVNTVDPAELAPLRQLASDFLAADSVEISVLDRLASLDTGPFPIISLYLNMQPNQHGRDQFEPFWSPHALIFASPRLDEQRVKARFREWFPSDEATERPVSPSREAGAG